MIVNRLNKLVILIVASLALSLISVPAEAAAKSSMSMTPIPASVVAGQSITVTGKVSGKLKGSKVRIQFHDGKKWKSLRTVLSNKKTGQWVAKIRVPVTVQRVTVRAISQTSKTKHQKVSIVAPLNLVSMGPGARILGVDLSRWQSSGNSLDFSRMAAAGVAFAFIKGSDGLLTEDALAVPHVTTWAPAAKAAGILVGYYHFARIPLTTDPNIVIADAQTQATQAAARLASLGGYDDRTLPYVLDVEGVNSKITDEVVT
jgi:hypothetical protein